MRTLKLLFLLILVTMTAFGQVVVHNTSKLYVDLYNGNGYTEYDHQTTIVTDFDNDVVYLDTLDYYKVISVKKTEFPKYKLVSCRCNDSQGRQVDLEYFLYKNSYYLKISYSDMCFKYKIYYKDIVYDSKSKVYRN